MPGINNTMREFYNRTLHSGSKEGPIVRKRKQALAIAFSEMRHNKHVRGSVRTRKYKKWKI